MNRELINRLIKDIENTGTPKFGLMRHFTKPCGSPSCIGGHLKSYFPKYKHYDIEAVAHKKLKIPETFTEDIIYPRFHFADYCVVNSCAEGHITKPMVIKFLKNLLKEEDPKICWWLASEGVVL